MFFITKMGKKRAVTGTMSKSYTTFVPYYLLVVDDNNKFFIVTGWDGLPT